MLQKIKGNFELFPNKFWVLMGATFVDQIGNWMLFPFFALYITDHFSVGMTQVGILMGIFSLSNLLGRFAGGAFADKFGRKFMLIFGLVVSASSSLIMAFIDDLQLFYMTAAIVGLVGSIAGPAQGAMVADLLPEDKRTEGFGVQRVVMNLAVTIGPVFGGLLASRSFVWLFIADAVTSIITGMIAAVSLPETKPEPSVNKKEETLLDSFKGYRLIARDYAFLGFVAVMILMNITYMQMNSTLSVYMRDVHVFPPESFGYLLSMNAMIVVLFQFQMARKVSNYPPMLVMAVGTAFYLVGFSMFGFVNGLALFAAAMVIITIGEITVLPVAQALVVKFSPEDMRGRYMGVYGLSWTVPSAIAPLLAGVVMDNYNPDWVWYGVGAIAGIAVLGYISLHLQANQRFAIESAAMAASD